MKFSYINSPSEARAAFFFILKRSKSFRLKMLFYTLVLISLPILFIFASGDAFRVTDILLAIGLGAGYILILPRVATLLSKSGIREVETTKGGLSITIGETKKTLHWLLLQEAITTETHLYVIGKTGNYLCIPLEAFANKKQQDEFFYRINHNGHSQEDIEIS